MSYFRKSDPLFDMLSASSAQFDFDKQLEANNAMLCCLTTAYPDEIWLEYEGMRFGRVRHQIHMRDNQELLAGGRRWVSILHQNMSDPDVVRLVEHLRAWFARCFIKVCPLATFLCSRECGKKIRFDPRRTDEPVCDECAATGIQVCHKCGERFRCVFGGGKCATCAKHKAINVDIEGTLYAAGLRKPRKAEGTDTAH